MGKGLYIHIPFCTNICSYCDFCKIIYSEKLCRDYLFSLKKEVEEIIKDDICSIYIGGGTPSSLSIENLIILMEIIAPYYKEGIPFTIEANIDSISKEKMILLKNRGVNRVSLGVQSFKDDIVKDMNRNHTKEDVFIVIKNLIDVGIVDINIDLIYGYPNQTLLDIKKDIDEAMNLPITHISTYALTVNDNTYLKLRNIEEMSQDVLAEEYSYIVEELKKHGFNRYEVSNFSKKGFESKHNLIYWKNCEYYGVGAGASSYVEGVRYDNTKSITRYIKGERKIYEEKLSKDDEEFYFIMLGLRMSSGISLIEYKNKYLQNFEDKYKDKLEKLIKNDLLVINENRLKVTEKNIFILDFILKRLLY